MSYTHKRCQPPAQEIDDRRLDFVEVNRAALTYLPALLARWLPSGRSVGNEWTALNPRRTDRRLGSFKVNVVTGRWCDFATGDKGGDPISLLAFLEGLRQIEAARLIADMLEIKS
jgi:hypothetical protein